MKNILIKSQQMEFRNNIVRNSSDQTDYLTGSPLVKKKMLDFTKARDEVDTRHLVIEDSNLKSNRASDVLLEGFQTPRSPIFQIKSPRMNNRVLDNKK